MQLGAAILAEAALSFLGIGIPPPGAAWGAMVNAGYKYLLTLPVLSFSPGIAIMLVVFAFYMVGDGLRTRWTPDSGESFNHTDLERRIEYAGKEIAVTNHNTKVLLNKKEKKKWQKISMTKILSRSQSRAIHITETRI